MSYQVYVYHKSVPSAKNQEKVDILRFFSQGVRISGDDVFDIYDTAYNGNDDVSVIQGWITDTPAQKGHQQLRQTVVKSQLTSEIGRAHV